jgi:ornithine carbamoyltransferase
VRHLLAIRDLTTDELRAILGLSSCRPRILETGEGVALYFEKPSARTRNSMEIAAAQLGLHPVYLQPAELGIGTRESVEDVTRTLACYHRIIAARVFDHGLLEQMAALDSAPVLNMLSGTDHPLQALADLKTIDELCGRIAGVKIAFVGDGSNNVARSLAEACDLLDAILTIAAPAGFQLEDAPPGVIQINDPVAAVTGADIVYTDAWVSMGQEAEMEARRAALAPYQVNEALMAHAPDAWFMHCLPAHRGEEVTAGVIDGPRSAVWRQAANRMHSARGALLWLLNIPIEEDA